MTNLWPGSPRRKENPNKQSKKWKRRNYDTAEIIKKKKPIKEYYKELHANKLDNLDEMDKFLETYSPPKLNQEEIDNLNRPIYYKWNRTCNKLTANKSPGLDGSAEEFY